MRRSSGGVRVVSLGLANFLLFAVLTPAAAEPSCPDAGFERVAIASVDARFEFALKDGRVLRLAGFEPVHPTPGDPFFDTKARDILRRELPNVIEINPLAQPDRWGRIPVFAFLPATDGNHPAQSLAAVLLAQGHGRFMPEPSAHACRQSFLAGEADARAARRGLWADPYYAVIQATDIAAFAERAATNVIVEGTVVRVEVRPKRIYLLFGLRDSHGFAVTIPQRAVKIFDRDGFDFHALIGQRIRVRGLLDLRFGPQIEVSEPDAIEIVPARAVSGEGHHIEAKAVDSSKMPQ